MKKMMLALITIFLLVGCGNEDKGISNKSNDAIKAKKELDETLAKYIKISKNSESRKEINGLK